MAIKKNQVVTVDLSKTGNVNYSGNKKVAINFTGAEDLTGINITSDGNNLYFYKGEDLIGTVTKASKIKSTKFDADSSYTTDVIAKLVAYTGTYSIKKSKVSGSNYNDTMDFSDSEIYKNGLTVNAGNGNDTITGTVYNDKITGGAGTNIINVYITKNFGNDEVVLTKGENLFIKIADYNGTGVSKYCIREYVKNDLKLSIYSEPYTYDSETRITTPNGELRGTITIKNYLKKNVQASGSFELVNSNNTSGYNLKESIITYMEPGRYEKSTYKGAWVDDNVRAKFYVKKDKNDNVITAETDGYEKVKGVTASLGGATSYNHFQGSIYADTVKGGNNSDHIYTSLGYDIYNLGKGEDTIVFLQDGGFDTDTINLTKGEKLTLDFSRYGYTTVDEFKENIKLSTSGKNLIIEAPKGKAVLKNYAQSNVVGSKGDVKFLIKAKTLTEDAIYVGMDEMQVTSSNGTWHNDFIDAHLTPAKIKKGKELTKGVSLNGKGGDDSIIGSNYYDTIKGGDGDDTIAAGKGNDKIYGEKGNNILSFNAGDGNDTVFSGKGTDTLKINATALNIQKGTGKNKRNLVVNYSYNEDGSVKDSITISNYFNKKGQPASSVKYIDYNGIVLNIEDLTDKNIITNGTSSTVNGSEEDDMIIATDTTEKLYGNG
ncbi:hypothetical protein II906_10500, partial [bacterium]|nr:hypothetical protein [bacterium]